MHNPPTGGCGCVDNAACTQQLNGFCEQGIRSSSWFIPGTRGAVADGASRPIETIRAGAAVLGRGGKIDRVGFGDAPSLGALKLYGLNGSQPGDTSEHPFATADGCQAIDPLATARENPSIPAQRLRVGDRPRALAVVRITAMAGGDADAAAGIRLEPVPLTSMIGVPAHPSTQLYNLWLDGDHAYLANDFLVHNRG